MELQLLNKIIEQLKIKENKSKDLRTICSDINAIAAIIMAILLSQGSKNAVIFGGIIIVLLVNICVHIYSFKRHMYFINEIEEVLNQNAKKSIQGSLFLSNDQKESYITEFDNKDVKQRIQLLKVIVNTEKKTKLSLYVN
ncbi:MULTISPECIES: hypothetical protein [Bacillus cereus group]|uniref:Uncharacterized protein n=1 Tax=Bacillus wiedmannii TaxID=1890302 RepID=A0A242Z163_9BACI|nr:MULTISPECIES: hypothetical protein [Bacillus cereus group]MBG9749578.1 hypothetical protein [Bacillus thuringiensis]MBG9782021.1 hypothetical protein [Bacillus thuringiensis]MCU7679405.1 hypothetical protein [Bacillus thuringiensis]OTX84832.1 hypothetical protein BK730_23945 [Bacillus wiedmannii]OTZ80634.1 hypothetical protein BK771_32730 [Bacillus thuringiensis serovar ostriniae]